MTRGFDRKEGVTCVRVCYFGVHGGARCGFGKRRRRVSALRIAGLSAKERLHKNEHQKKPLAGCKTKKLRYFQCTKMAMHCSSGSSTRTRYAGTPRTSPVIPAISASLFCAMKKASAKNAFCGEWSALKSTQMVSSARQGDARGMTEKCRHDDMKQFIELLCWLVFSNQKILFFLSHFFLSFF